MIKARLGGEVAFRMPASSAFEFTELAVRRADGSWSDATWLQRTPERRATAKLHLPPPGETAWRARFHPEAVEGRRGPPREVEGKVTVIAGSSEVVVLSSP